MNYQQSMEFMEEVARRGSRLGLESMSCLLEYLNNPQNELRFIHIAGTNGKGSVLAFISTVMQKAGYKTGRYLSPSVFSYCEKMQVNQKAISKIAVARYLTKLKETMHKMEEDGKPLPTIFEIETAVSFLYFRDQKCDIVVLETGMGGLTDATNVITNTQLAIITPISLDHCDFLGNTIEEIAQHKAGIIKEGCNVISAPQEPMVCEIIKRKCEEKKVLLSLADYTNIKKITYGIQSQKFSYQEFENIVITMAGAYHVENATLALEALRMLRKMGVEIPDWAIRQGMEETKWLGRFSVIGKKPLFIVDGAHNKAGAKMLAQSLRLYFPNQKIIYIMGVFADKEYEEMIEITCQLASHIITVSTPGNSRALPAYDLALAAKKHHNQVTVADSLEEAVEISQLLSEKDTVTVAFGSLSFLGRIITILLDKNGKS